MKEEYKRSARRKSRKRIYERQREKCSKSEVSSFHKAIVNKENYRKNCRGIQRRRKVANKPYSLER